MGDITGKRTTASARSRLTELQLVVGLKASHRADMRRRLDNYFNAGFIDGYELDGHRGKIGVLLDDRWYELELDIATAGENKDVESS